MAYQPISSTANLQTDVEGSGLIYKANAAAVDGSYAIGELIEIQTKTVSGVTTTQYFNSSAPPSGKVIPKAAFDDGITAGELTLVADAMAKVMVEAKGAAQGRTVVDPATAEEIPFTIEEWATANSITIPAGTKYVELEMQRRPGTEYDYFLYTQDVAPPSILAPQKGQSETDVKLRNLMEIANAKFLGVPAIAGGEVVLIAKFWSSDPN